MVGNVKELLFWETKFIQLCEGGGIGVGIRSQFIRLQGECSPYRGRVSKAETPYGVYQISN